MELNGAKILYTIHTNIPVLGDFKITQTLVSTWIVIDMPSATELIAHGREVDEIRQIIGADGLIFQDLNDLIGRPEASMACAARSAILRAIGSFGIRVVPDTMPRGSPMAGTFTT